MEPLVLLPGMNCSARLWEPVLGAFGEREVRHELVDGDDLDDAVHRLLAALPERFALAGLSLGGIVAMALHRQAPERVTRLALLDTNPLAPTPAQIEGWRTAAQRVRDGLTAADFQAELLPVLVAAENREALAAEVVAMGADIGDELLVRQLLVQCHRIDERPGLAGVRVPTLVLFGALDALCPRDRHEAIADAVPGARLIEVPGAGHLSPLERPEEVGDALRRWLTDERSGRR